MSTAQNILWRTFSPVALRPLAKEVKAEVAIVGAGVAGLTAAHILAQAGLETVVIEATGIGAGMTGHSTAHISGAVDGGWREMVKRLGVEAAAHLASGYRRGIDAIEDLATSLPEKCDFAWVEGELLAERRDQDVLGAEMDAAHLAGLTVTPIQRASAADGLLSIHFPRQARLHPLKYVDGIARQLLSRGIGVYHAELKGLREMDGGVELGLGNDVVITAARGVVLAHNLRLNMHYPHVVLSRRHSYVIAAEFPDDGSADTITWDLAHPYHYTRIAHDRGQRMLMVGGADHAAAKIVDADAHFSTVERWMRSRFPGAGAVRYRWSGDLKQTSDNLALLGRLPQFANVYVIDGDTGLGFNHAMLGAQIIRDALLRRTNDIGRIFDPARRNGLS